MAPHSSRAVWEFMADGIFDCVNPELIAEAKRRGCVFGEEAEAMYLADHAAPPAPAVDAEAPSAEAPKRRGRPKKEAI